MISLPVAYLLIFIFFLLIFRKIYSPKSDDQDLKVVWGWPILGNIHWFLNHNPSKTLMQVGDRYGDIFFTKFGSTNVLVLNGLKAAREACSYKPLNGRPDCEFKTLANNKGYLFADDNSTFRKFVIPYFKHYSLNKSFQEKMIHFEIKAFMDFILDMEGSSLEFKNIFSIPTLNVIFQLVLGERFERDDPVFQNIINTINVLSALPNPLTRAAIFMPWLTQVDPAGLLGTNLPRNLIADAREVCQAHFAEHQQSRVEGQPRDMTDAYIDKFGDTMYYSEISKEEKSEWSLVIEELFIGGVETTGGVLEWIMAYLAHHPEIQGKLQEEIDDSIEEDRLPNLADRQSMQYTQAVIEEVLRLKPILGFGYHGAPEDTTFKGQEIPRGTFVLVNFYSVNHDPEHWPNSEAFDPQRFIDGSGKFKKSEHMLTFGFGRRSCPGEIWARDQIFLFTVAILKKFSVFPSGPFPDFSFGVLARAKKFQLIFHKRSLQRAHA